MGTFRKYLLLIQYQLKGVSTLVCKFRSGGHFGREFFVMLTLLWFWSHHKYVLAHTTWNLEDQWMSLQHQLTSQD